jgi:ADP-ribose pyrophosphatase YjhB (NUDIX family)
MTLTEGAMNPAAIEGKVLKKNRIRMLSLGIFRRGDSIFVAEGYDPVKGETFYRPLGGGVEFGERAVDALIREMREETGLEVANLRYAGMCENIFTYLGERGHEIVLVYEADFTDPAVYENDEMLCQEDDGLAFKAVWKPISEFGKDKEGPLYPNGLMEMLSSKGQRNS